jgi:uncharacterized protein (DUF1015 family)
MAHIKPFRGIRYNPERIAEMASVVCPPYDIISGSEQTAYYDRNPYNVIRMELGLSRPEDDDSNNHHTRAGAYLRTWLKENILIQEKRPAFYFAATDFQTADGTRTRWGLLAAVALEPFDKGNILPHERTYSKVKSERLALMRACPANLSPIFSFFSDQASTIPQLQSHVARKAPVFDFKDHNQHRHRLWVIDDADLIADIVAQLRYQPIFIADGHHRYETALTYRDERATQGDLGEDHPANYTLMYLSSIQDPGLMILPAHRLLPQVDLEIRHRFLKELSLYFEIQTVPSNGSNKASAKDVLRELNHTSPGEGLVVALRDVSAPLLLKLKADRKRRLYPEDIPDVLKDIDVTLLSEFIFPKFLSLTPNQLDDVNRIHYHHDTQIALEYVRTGKYDMAFIIKPTPIAAVQRIADAGRIMPRKSTYFAPKVISGLVLHGLVKHL